MTEIDHLKVESNIESSYECMWCNHTQESDDECEECGNDAFCDTTFGSHELVFDSHGLVGVVAGTGTEEDDYKLVYECAYCHSVRDDDEECEECGSTLFDAIYA